MFFMSDAFDQLLDATIQHLQELKTHGVRFVSISPEHLTALNGSRVTGPKGTFAPPPPAQPVSRPPVDPRPAVPALPAVKSATAAGLSLGIPSEIAPAPALSPEAKTTAFAELRQRALACVKCPHLASSRKNVAFGVGSIHAELMFVGEAPGADEDEQGEPFVGEAVQVRT